VLLPERFELDIHIIINDTQLSVYSSDHCPLPPFKQSPQYSLPREMACSLARQERIELT
jgi:hypothetical protein